MYQKIISITIIAALFIVLVSVATVHSFTPSLHTEEIKTIESTHLEAAKTPKGATSFNELPVRSSFFKVISGPAIFSGPYIQRSDNQLKANQATQTEKAVPHKPAPQASGNALLPSSISGTCTVTTTEDSGPNTLRQCLLDASEGNTIDFDSQAFPPSTPVTIAPLSPLPSIIANNLTIDGSNAGVILNGRELSQGDALVIDGATGVTIQGLQILSFPWVGIRVTGGASNAVIGGNQEIGTAPLGQGNLVSNNGSPGIWIEGAETSNNQVIGNYIGTDVSGSVAFGNTIAGIVLTAGANDNTIGGQTPDKRNVISGNNGPGVQIQYRETSNNQILLQNEETSNTSNNQILGNYIGTDATGMEAVGNSEGVLIGFGAKNNIIGGNTEGARNIISGNESFLFNYGRGIVIQDEETTGNQVLGNYIGTDVTGTQALGNEIAGVAITLGANNNIIGNNAAGNLISGNGEDTLGLGWGILIAFNGTDENYILGNYIGTDVTGTQALGNNLSGIAIGTGASHNVIGGDTAGSGNIISGNQDAGIALYNNSIFEGIGPSENQVLGNRIGTDVTGTRPIPNKVGVGMAFGAMNNVIGGDTPEARNLISGNRDRGIEIVYEGTDGNHILGNYIGTDATGESALGNGPAAILIAAGAKNNVIGAQTAGSRNIISGNSGVGIQIQNEQTSGNQVIGNYIGTNVTGTLPLSNSVGIGIAFGATDNTIGGDTAGARNLISGNSEVGLVIQNNDTTDNQVLGNYIGTNVTGTLPLANGGNGLEINDGASNNTVGGELPDNRNLISGNGKAGVYLEGNQTSNNHIYGNYVGTDALGAAAVPNAGAGVHLQNGANVNTIGISNTIAYNEAAGVVIENETTLGNTITRNMIFQNNGPPIDWSDTDSIPSPPTLTSYSDNVLLGNTCNNCLVEIFAGQTSNPPEIRVFLDEVTADANGHFTFTSDNPPPLCYLSATATDQNGTTSELSSGLDTCSSTTTPTPTGTATQTPTLTGTATPTTSTTTPTLTGTATPTVGAMTPTVTGTATPTVGTTTPTATSTPTSSVGTTTPTPIMGTTTPTVTRTVSPTPSGLSYIYLPLVIK